MALVPFSTTAGNVSNFTDNAMDIVSAVNGLGADGGTNWEAALKAANAKLTSGRKGVKKYIVFMSDGDPTFRTSSVRTGTDWWGRPTYDDDDRRGLPAGVHGSGSSDQYGANLSSAVARLTGVAMRRCSRLACPPIRPRCVASPIRRRARITAPPARMS